MSTPPRVKSGVVCATETLDRRPTGGGKRPPLRKVLMPAVQYCRPPTNGRRTVSLSFPTLPLRPEDGRDKPDAAIRQTSAQSVADTRREGCPAWQRARYPSGLCGRVVSRFRPGWIVPHPTTGAATAGAL